ncbi:hypothetical protein Syun_003080 [Stephania yunnanensis]|uniref:WIBG Mago-binding domain-containing protein n=1 Tax=Stephania yunnanensis TaxID=152371 RepID=A0AAP0L0J7_9MAGN
MESSGGGAEEQFAQLGKTLKEGERILAPTRRPDGTLRKAIRIRAGYVPQDEVAIYQSKGALLKKNLAAPEVPPGYDPLLDAKRKTKAAKRNERKKEKKQQAALEKGKNIDLKSSVSPKVEGLSADDEAQRSESVESVAYQMDMLSVSENASVVPPFEESAESSNPDASGPDLDRRIRALKKKIRLAEAQQQKAEKEDSNPEQLDKLSKLDDWRKALKLLEEKKSELSAS